ncbi:MAG: methionine aminotransferase [Pseudomonadota bacterium]
MAITVNSKLPEVGTTIFSVMSAMAAEYNAINLSQGFPDYNPPEALVDAMCEALRDGRHQYAPMIGLPALRDQLARLIGERYKREVDANTEITIGPGATEAIYCAITALVGKGDEVIVFDPAFDCYVPAIDLAEAKSVHIPFTSGDFKIDWEQVRESINDRTRMIILNTPQNPTGTTLTTADLEQLAEVTRDTDIVVLSDEVYEYLVFDGEQHCSVLGHDELYARSVAVFSFGKTFHATGWKTGYCVAPANLMTEVRKVHQYVTFTANTAVQYALAKFYAEDTVHLSGLGAFYQGKRDLFCGGLKRTKFAFTPSTGTYFQLVDYSALSELPDTEFCNAITRRGVAAIPLSPFYKNPPNHRLARFCFAKNDETLLDALDILASFDDIND